MVKVAITERIHNTETSRFTAKNLLLTQLVPCMLSMGEKEGFHTLEKLEASYQVNVHRIFCVGLGSPRWNPLP
jgi:hypothetical protein